MTISVTVAHGDGIGRDAMHCVLCILREIGAPIKIDSIEIGRELHRRGYIYGINNSSLDIIKKNPILFKSSIAISNYEEFQDPSHFIMNELDLFGKISYFNGVKNNKKNLHIFSFNNKNKDFDAEYRQTEDSYVLVRCLDRKKINTIIRHLFEYSIAFNKKKITFVSCNQMKLNMRNPYLEFENFSNLYNQIEVEKLCEDKFLNLYDNKNNEFTMVFVENFFDQTITNLNKIYFKRDKNFFSRSFFSHEKIMFETPNIALKDIESEDSSNFCGLINAAINMLIHINQSEKAEIIQNSLLFTIESNIRTKCMNFYADKVLSVEDFTKILISNFGKSPKNLEKANFYSKNYDFVKNFNTNQNQEKKKKKVLIGVELFIDFNEGNADRLAENLLKAKSESMSLRAIKKDGKIVWPSKNNECSYYNYYRCILSKDNVGQELTHEEINSLIYNLCKENIDITSVNKLYSFDDLPGFLPITS